MGLARDHLAGSGLDIAMPGLQNEAGEYNCFLNVIIQCLWHCQQFRHGVLGLPPGLIQGAFVCARRSVSTFDAGHLSALKQ